MNDKQNDKHRFLPIEDQLAEQTVRILESPTIEARSKDDQATVELGQLLRDAAKENLPESNDDLREQLLAQLGGEEASADHVTVAGKEVTADKLAVRSAGRRRFWVATAASGLLLVGGTIAYNSGFVGTLSNVAMLEDPIEAVSEPPVAEPPVVDRVVRGDEARPEVAFRTENRTKLVPVTKMRFENKTRSVPITKLRGETRRVKQADGSFKEETILVPYTEQVSQGFTVQVPYTENVEQDYTVEVPYTAEGKRIEKSDYDKYGLGDSESSAAPAESFPFPSVDEWKGQGRRSRVRGLRLAGEAGASAKTDKGKALSPADPTNDYKKRPGGQRRDQLAEKKRWQPDNQSGVSVTGVIGQFKNQLDGPPNKAPGTTPPLSLGTVAGDSSSSDSTGSKLNRKSDKPLARPAKSERPAEFLSGGELPGLGSDDTAKGSISRKSPVGGTSLSVMDGDSLSVMDGDGDGGGGGFGGGGGPTAVDGQHSSGQHPSSSEGQTNGMNILLGVDVDINGVQPFAGRPEDMRFQEFQKEIDGIEVLELQRDKFAAVGNLGPGTQQQNTLNLLIDKIDKRKARIAELEKGLRDGLQARDAYFDSGLPVKGPLFRMIRGEQYEPIFENAFIAAKGPTAISTFSIDVDTASYANMRRLLNSGQRPPVDSIRLEELVNYFKYDYAQPTGEHPFSVNLELADCPWQDGHQLLRVGLKGKDVHVEERPATNVVFLIDVSGSMSSNDKLPLLKSGFKMMSRQLGENDRVSIVTYAGSAGVALSPTNGTQTETINNAIDLLSSGGSTHGSAGIKLAYELAQQNFIEGGVNRVMLATDGDLNVGVTSDDALVSLIKEKAAEGVFLTVLGFGTGNLKDGKLEKLADNGNGMYAYVDSTREARRVLVDQLSGSLVTIAKDVKIQVEFNPAEVKSYRLLGYENRMLETKDFDDDRKDAGEIGAGHSVTAIYQIEPAKAVARPVSLPSGMKYQVQADLKPDLKQASDVEGADKDGLSEAALSGELATVALRYKQPEASESQRLEVSIKNQPKRFMEASPDFRFASSVAGFGMYLRNSKHRGSINAGQLQQIASGAIGKDEAGYRSEFIDLIRKASGR